MIILDKIWGSTFPSEDFLREDREYFELLREAGKIEAALGGQLSDEQGKILRVLLDKNSDAAFLGYRDAFAFGVRVGAMIMIDEFCE